MLSLPHARVVINVCACVSGEEKRKKTPETNFSRYIVQREVKLNSPVLRARVMYTSAFRSCFRNYDSIYATKLNVTIINVPYRFQSFTLLQHNFLDYLINPLVIQLAISIYLKINRN